MGATGGTRGRALLLGVPATDLNVSLSIERLSELLPRLGIARIERCVGDEATRTGILLRLDTLVREAEPEQPVLVYYFGHGGRVRFPKLPAPWHEYEHSYVTCTREVLGRWEAVLDIELSSRLAALDARCGNVTAIFDCCYSGEVVRNAGNTMLGHARLEPLTDWVRAALHPKTVAPLALGSHPAIVRLMSTSPQREAFAVQRRGRQIGLLTEAFIAVLDEVGDRWRRLCWASLGLRVREYLITARKSERQWINLAGPRTRRLLSTESVQWPGTVAALPEDSPGRAWLRAGWHQGVAVGDRWSVLDLCTDDAGQPQVVANGTIDGVDRNRSLLVLDSPVTLVPGSPACVSQLRMGMPVVATAGTRTLVDASPWLAMDEARPQARVCEDDGNGELLLEDPFGEVPEIRLPDNHAGRAMLRSLLDDRGQLWTLRRSLADHQSEPCPLQWHWSRVGDSEPLPLRGASLHTGDQICVTLEYEGTDPLSWFASVLLVDPAGRLVLLNPRMPEGLELRATDRELIGVRRGRVAEGMTLRWPEGMAPTAAPSSLLLLASRRPIMLEHLVSAVPLDDDFDLGVGRPPPPSLRGSEPEPARSCAWDAIHFTLHPSR